MRLDIINSSELTHHQSDPNRKMLHILRWYNTATLIYTTLAAINYSSHIDLQQQIFRSLSIGPCNAYSYSFYNRIDTCAHRSRRSWCSLTGYLPEAVRNANFQIYNPWMDFVDFFIKGWLQIGRKWTNCLKLFKLSPVLYELAYNFRENYLTGIIIWHENK